MQEFLDDQGHQDRNIQFLYIKKFLSTLITLWFYIFHSVMDHYQYLQTGIICSELKWTSDWCSFFDSRSFSPCFLLNHSDRIFVSFFLLLSIWKSVSNWKGFQMQHDSHAIACMCSAKPISGMNLYLLVCFRSCITWLCNISEKFKIIFSEGWYIRVMVEKQILHYSLFLKV